MNKKVLHTLIDEHSHHQGERIAIKETLGGLSYIKLRAYSNAIGHGLVGLGLLPGEAAGVYLPGGMGYVSAILGVNKAGGIFMPLERKYPDNRLRWLLEYVSPGLIITDAEGAEKLKAITQEGSYRLGRLLVISLSPSELRMREYEASTGYSAELTLCTADVAIDLTGEEGNYLLYTSGSTGYPKVIEGCHKSLSHFIHWEVKEFGLNSESLVSQLVPLSFDVSLRDIFAPLLSGGTLCIPDEGLKGDPVGLLKWIRSEGITLIHTVPSLLRLLTRELELNPGLKAGLSTLQHLLLSGEALYGKDVLHWRKAAGGGVELVNLYGPTETTLAKVYNRIGDDAGDPGAVIPLGNPLPNTAVLILESNQLCQIGAIGEIYIKTPFRSRGYYKDASLTAGSFIQNPLHNDYEDIVYRTGDLGKYLADRSIAFVGRQDSQVKIRGNRVELSETERVLHGYPGISQAVVIAIKGADESDVLACYYVATGAIDDDELRNYLKAHLPDYMHPSYFCQLDEFPLNLNGKVNRKALPRPEDLLYEKVAYQAPSNALEEQLANIWSSLLGLGRVGVNNSFFDLGGHSLTATKAVSRIFSEVGTELSLKDFFEHPTISRLSAYLSGRKQGSYRQISPLPRQEHYALSHAQKLIWVLDQSTDEMIAYNMPASCLLNGELDKDAFVKTFQTIISRHEILRTTFQVVAGEPRQQVHEEIGFKLEEEDISASICLTGNRESLIRHYAATEFSRPFNLHEGPLLRAKLLKLDARQHLFLFTMHHIISDGWSMGLLVREILELYRSYSQGGDNLLEPLKVQYKDYAAWHNSQLESGEMKSHGDYWQQQLGGELPLLNLPLDYPRGSIRSYEGDKLRFTLSKEQSDRIRQICSEQEVSLFMFFTALINVLLYSYSGQNDIIIGSPISGRNHEDIEKNIGMFLNNLVFRNWVNGSDTFNAFLQQVKQTVLDAYGHQQYPFAILVDDLNILPAENRNPFYDVLIVVNNNGLNGSAQDWEAFEEALGFEAINTEEGISKLDLSFFANDADNILITTEYNTDLFKKQTVQNINEALEKIIVAVISDCDTLLSDLSALCSDADDLLLKSNNLQILHEDF